MDLKGTLTIIEIILSIILIILIILQSKGVGLSSSMGGDMGFYGTRRGAERLLFTLTIIISVLFLSISFISVLV